MARQDDNKLAFGLTMVVYGLIFLLDKAGILQKFQHGEVFTDFRVLLLIAGIIFLVAKKDKTWGIVLTSVGVLLNADFFFGWFEQFSAITIPLMLIVAGVILIFRSKR